jgi:hypothetical protein
MRKTHTHQAGLIGGVLHERKCEAKLVVIPLLPSQAWHSMNKLNKPELDEATKQIAARLLQMPPKRHDEMKIGKPMKSADNPKTRPASKGRVHKGRTKD